MKRTTRKANGNYKDRGERGGVVKCIRLGKGGRLRKVIEMASRAV